MLSILSNASATIAEGEVLQLTAATDLATDRRYLSAGRARQDRRAVFCRNRGGRRHRRGPRRAGIKALFDYGDALGISFQIVDDLLDYQGDSAATGKNVGDDFRERKLTLPVIKAVAKADAEERAFWVRTIEKGRQEEGDLEHALSLLNKHNTLEETRQDAVAWATKAKDALQVLPDHPVRQLLIEIADYVVARIN